MTMLEVCVMGDDGCGRGKVDCFAGESWAIQPFLRPVVGWMDGWMNGWMDG